MKLFRIFLPILLSLPGFLRAQKAESGLVRGSVVESAANRPVEYVALTLKRSPQSEKVRAAASDSKGSFEFADVPFGDYLISYGAVGGDMQDSAPFTLDAQHRTVDLGQLKLADGVVKLDKVQVSARAETFYNSIDRKVYNVGKDIQSANGSASELMQNIPSVQVDIDGNVSLRGSESVLILIDGKPSTLMGANRAAVLEQMPADTIDRIEVITNPSAKYKPDGTAGIINIVLKRKRTLGYSGSARATVGNSRRYSLGLNGNYNPGKYNLSGSYSIRQDDRSRTATDDRTHLDAPTGTFLGTRQRSVEKGRPLSHIAQAGVDYKVDDDTKLSATAKFNYRSFTRHTTQSNQFTDGLGALQRDYDRIRTMPEGEQDAEVKTSYQHSFANEGEELSVELQGSDHKEKDDAHYVNIYRVPVSVPTYDNKRVVQNEKGTEALAEYVKPLADDAKLETGYSVEGTKIMMDHFSNALDPVSGLFVTDATVTNYFVFNSTIHSLYGTYGRPFGKFGLLAGLRVEQTYLKTNQVTANLVNTNDYLRAYPTLHLNYNLTETGQLQLNYSRRVRRPEGDDLNPYPEYQDPFNLRAGNPYLKPEDIHSIESGYQYKKDSTTYLAGVYARYLTHGMTEVTRYIDSTTQLTTKENLSTSRSAGVELAATTDLGEKTSLNFSSNIYHNQIDASNLGFGSKRSTIAWDAKLSANYHASKTTLVQLNTNFTAKRLTPQGYRYPTYVANVGLKHDLKDRRTSLVLTVSDLFDSLKERTKVDTAILHEEISRRRTSRIVYLGVIYNLGKSTKKAKEEALQFDNAP